jgi:hypothetical protein
MAYHMSADPKQDPEKHSSAVGQLRFRPFLRTSAIVKYSSQALSLYRYLFDLNGLIFILTVRVFLRRFGGHVTPVILPRLPRSGRHAAGNSHQGPLGPAGPCRRSSLPFLIHDRESV